MVAGEAVKPGLVDVVRDFLAAHALMRRSFERYRRGELRFGELTELVGDDERSVLFRLKERCHALFRPAQGSGRVDMRREALFDLAVGSLFHEAMSFRENYYQLEVYAPRVRALRSESGEEDDELFREFEKLLASVAQRLDGGLVEGQNLLERTREQLVVLLTERREDGPLVRFLVEHEADVKDVFPQGLDALLADMFGSPAEGFAAAARSYLTSGYFEEAQRACADAIARSGDRRTLERLSDYGQGMAAYRQGEYAQAVESLSRWIADTEAEEEERLDLAQSAVSRIGQLVQGQEGPRVAERATELLERLRATRRR